MVKLSSVAEILNGDRSSNYPSGKDFIAYGIPFINAGHLKNGKIDFSNMDYISKQKYEQLSGAKIQKKDILLCLRGSLGKYAVAEIDAGAPASSIAVIRPNKTIIASEFLTCIISSFLFQKQIDSENNGSSQPNLSASSVANFIIPFPPLDEQKRIAEALSDVDSMISSLEKLIAKKKAVKDGAMAMLLTARKRMAGFSKEWEFFQFKDTGIEIRKGQTITQKDVKFGNIPVVAGGKTPAYYCDKYNRDGKNITISASGASAGFVNMYSGKIFASDCSTISENEKYNIVFVYNMLKFLQSDIYASQTGGAQPHIHPNDIGELYLYYTFDIEEQNAIASVLSDMDNEIEALEQKLEKAHYIKQGMMQQLLTGKIRLI